MKTLKAFSSLLLVMLAFTFAFVCVACRQPEDPTPPEAVEIVLNQTTTEITVGESLDYSGFALTVKYKDGAKDDETVPLTQAMITNGLSSLSEVGTHELTVTYLELTTKLTVTVKPVSTPPQNGVTITLNKTTAEITVGESLNYSEFTVSVDYEDPAKTDKVVTLTADMITAGLSSLSEVGTHVLTVTVEGATATLTVKVNPAPETTVELSLNKTTAEITVDEDLDYSEFVITVKHKDGSADTTVTLTEEMIEDGLFNLSTVGTHVLTIKVMGATVKLTVTVNPKTMGTVTLTGNNKTYDGNPATVSINGLPQGAQVAYTYYEGEAADEDKKVDSMVDAGTYFVKAVVSATNYADKEVTAKVVISKAHISVANVTWSNTGYRYTGEEIVLAATANGLPDYVTYEFTAEEDGAVKATESGYYTAVAHFTSTNKNYTVDASCTLTWRIIETTSLAFAPWYAVENGQLKAATFEESEDGVLVLHFGEDTVTGTVEYTDVITVTFPAETGYTLTVDEDVMSITKDEETVYLLSDSYLNRLAGVYSTYLNEFGIAFDKTEKTATLTVTPLDGTADTFELSLVGSQTEVQLAVGGEDYVLVCDFGKESLMLKNYANPANYNAVEDFYLPTKAAVEAFMATMTVGEFASQYDSTTVFGVTEDKFLTYNGHVIKPVIKGNNSSDEVKLSFSPETSSALINTEIFVYDGYYGLRSGSTTNLYIPIEYKEFFGIYYAVKEDGTLNSSDEVAFQRYGGYYGLIMNNSVRYYKNVDGDRLKSLTLAEGKLTATIKPDDEEAVNVVFNGDGTLTFGEKTYKKAKFLFNSNSSYWFYNITNGQYIADNGNGTVKIYGTNYPYKSFAYTERGAEYTIEVDGEDKVLIYANDPRYIIYDGVVHIYESIASITNGRDKATFYHGDDTIAISNIAYTLKIDGTSFTLENVVHSIVDDGNNNGRTIIQAVGEYNGTTYTVKCYSLATVIVNDGEKDVAYYGSTFRAVVGSEFKPSAESDSVFAYREDGKMYLNGQEVFPTSTSNYTRFILNDEYGTWSYGCDVNGIRLRFNNGVVWNIDYYLSAYFEFGGAYISDSGKAFYFDAYTVYYTNSSNSSTYSTSFSAVSTPTGAKLTVSSKDAIFTRVESGAHTLVYDGVTYTKVTDFDIASYYGKHDAFDGTDTPNNLTFSADTTISAFVVYDGNITPVLNGTGDSGYYLIKNTDAATSANLPILAVQKKFVNLLGSTTLNGKTLNVVLEAVPKANSTDYITTVTVKYEDEAVTVSGTSTFKVTLGGTEYVIEANTDSATKAGLPVLVYEAWFNDFKGTGSSTTYTYNGKTLKIELVVVASGENLVPALKYTYDNADVTANVTVNNVEGARTIEFTKDGVNYKTVVGGTPAVAVYTEAEFNFFFANNLTNTVGGKALVLGVKPANGVTAFDLANSTYDGKVLTFAKYMYADSVLIFGTADGYNAYDIAVAQFYGNVMTADEAPLVDLNFSYGYASGDPLSSTNVAGSLTFDKGEGKAVVTLSSGGYTKYPVTSYEKISDGVYKVVGKTYNSSSTDVEMYLFVGATTSLMLGEQYNFPGEYTVDGKTLVTAFNDGVYTASYNGGTAVSITPNFTNRNFVLKTTDKTYFVTWTYSEGFTFTVSEVSAEVMAFEGDSYSTYITLYLTNLYDLTVTYTGNNSSGRATYSIRYLKVGDSYPSTVTGTLSADGQRIEGFYISSNAMALYLNKNSDAELKYIMVHTSITASRLMGKFDMGDSEVIIGVDTTPTFDEDDEVNGYERTKFVVTLDGKACEVATAWYVSTSTIEFSCEGKTYTATYASGSVTVAEKAEA